MSSLDKLAALREANKKRLLGLDPDAKVAAPYTKADVASSADVCWDIISMCVRKTTEETVGKNGKTYSKQGKDLQFPNLVEKVVVGERATTKQAKTGSVKRTNLDTMDEMYKTRNAMFRHYQDDKDDEYVDYFAGVVEVLDGYAMAVVADMIEADAEFLDKVNAARGIK